MKSNSVKTLNPGTVIPSVQFLRALAALMVLVFHASYMAKNYGGYAFTFDNTGAAGVDIFFVISGFIITYVTRAGDSSPLEFLVRRLIRIAPPYWFYSMIAVLILLAMPSAFARLKFDSAHVIFSALFLLSTNNAHTVGTVLGVGWTVCYEFYFYLLFAVFMLAPKRWSFPAMTGVIVLGALLEPVVAAPPFTWVALSALPLEFLGGCLLAKLYLRGALLPALPAILAILAGCAMMYWAGAEQVVARDRDPWRVVYFGLPALCLTAGLLSLDGRGLLRFPRWSLAIGDASYSLYLSHQFVLVAVGKAWALLGLTQRLPLALLLLAGTVIPVVVALLAYRWMEKPVTLWLNARWRRARTRGLRLAPARL